MHTSWQFTLLTGLQHAAQIKTLAGNASQHYCLLASVLPHSSRNVLLWQSMEMTKLFALACDRGTTGSPTRGPVPTSTYFQFNWRILQHHRLQSLRHRWSLPGLEVAQKANHQGSDPTGFILSKPLFVLYIFTLKVRGAITVCKVYTSISKRREKQVPFIVWKLGLQTLHLILKMQQ